MRGVSGVVAVDRRILGTVKRPMRTKQFQAATGLNGYSKYDDTLVSRAKMINLAQRLGFTLGEIGQSIETYDADAMGDDERVGFMTEKMAEIQQRIEGLQAMHGYLAAKIAWVCKSFRPKDEEPPSGNDGRRNEPADFRGQARKNDTHASTSDQDARLYRKGNTGAQLCYQGHVLTENRSGLARDA
jgi:DNA-binding transcriptional MerR regulator